MQVKVLYFASLRDKIGKPGEMIDIPGDASTLAGVREALVVRGEPWNSAFKNLRRIRGAVNQEMAEDDAAVKDGDEVAFFPPGGLLFPSWASLETGTTARAFRRCRSSTIPA